MSAEPYLEGNPPHSADHGWQSATGSNRKEKEEVVEVAGEVEVLNFTSCSLRCLSEGGGVGANTLTSG